MIDYSQLPFSKGPSRYEEKAANAKAEARTIADVYALVDQRDGPCCRICGCYLQRGGLTILSRAHHHHITPRSLNGPTTPENLVRLCSKCHEDEHRCRIRISGDADECNELGMLAGVKVERLENDTWKIWKFC
jgi:hypothetical protein